MRYSIYLLLFIYSIVSLEATVRHITTIEEGYRPILSKKTVPFLDPVTIATPIELDVTAVRASFQNSIAKNLKSKFDQQKNGFLEKIDNLKNELMQNRVTSKQQKAARQFYDNGEEFLNALNKMYTKYAKMIKKLDISAGMDFLMGAAYSHRGFDVTMIFRDVGFDEQANKAYFGFVGKITFSGQSYAVAAPKVFLNGDGKIDNQFKMSFLGNYKIDLMGKNKLILKGMPSMADKIDESYSYFNFSFTNIIEGMALVGQVELSENFIPVDPKALKQEGQVIHLKQHISVPVRIEAPDFQNMLFSISIPPFTTKTFKDFVFQVEQLTIDASDLTGDSQMSFPSDYSHPFAGQDLWRGFYLKNAAIYLPQSLSNGKKRTTVRSNYMLVDDTGLSGHFEGTDLISIQQGKWGENFAFSLDYVEIKILQNQLTYGGLNGGLLTSLTKKDKPYKYRGEIGYNQEGKLDLLLEVSGIKKMNIDLFLGEVTLNENTQFGLKYVDGVIEPEFDLHGKFALKQDNLSLKDIHFKGLKISRQALDIESLSTSYQGDLGGMALNVSQIDLTVKGKTAQLVVQADVVLTEGISGGSRITIHSKNNNGWQFTNIEVNKIHIAGSMGVASFEGEIFYKKGDAIYGDVFAGSLALRVQDSFEVKVSAAFGNKQGYSFFFMDALTKLSPQSAIPVPPLAITGLGGAFGYHVEAQHGQESSLVSTPSGAAYIPNKRKGLYLRFSIDYILQGAETMLNGKGVYEIQFNTNWGIDRMGIFGKVSVMTALDISSREDLVAATQQMNKANAGTKQIRSFDLDEETKQFYPFEVNPNQDGFHGLMGLSIDIQNGALDARADLFMKAGVVLRGRAFMHFHYSSRGWFMKVGEPAKRNKIEVGIPSMAYMEVQAYFMVGTLVPDIPDPPSEVMNILRDAGVTYKPTSSGGPKEVNGIVFGFMFKNSSKVSTGPFYASFEFGAGFDVSIRDYQGFSCKGREGTIGFNGWYGQGQAYAWLDIEVGIEIDTFFYSGSFSILESKTAILMQMTGPNPWWFRGTLAGTYDICGGAITGRYALTIEFGTKCEMEMTRSPLERLDIISDLSPGHGQKAVDVYTTPMLVLNMAANTHHIIEIPRKKDIHYKLILDTYTLTDPSGKKVPGRVVWNSTNDIANFSSTEILPGSTTLTAKVALIVMTMENGEWIRFKNKQGEEVREEKEVTFTTGPEPPFINPDNIQYAYPLPQMDYFYPKESPNGYIKLKRGRTNLLSNLQGAKAVFIDQDERTIQATFSYDASNLQINYQLPNGFTPKGDYQLALVTSRKGQGQQAETKNKAKVIQDDPYNETVIRQRQIVGSAISDGDQILLTYPIHVSKFSTFREKMGRINLNGYTSTMVTGPYTRGLLQFADSDEPFSPQEYLGSKFSENIPLIRGVFAQKGEYYSQIIKPMIYDNKAISAQLANLKEYMNYKEDIAAGIPPLRSIVLQSAVDAKLNYLPLIDKTYHYFYLHSEKIGAMLYIDKDTYSEEEKSFLDFNKNLGGLPPSGTIIPAHVGYVLPGVNKMNNTVDYEYKY